MSTSVGAGVIPSLPAEDDDQIFAPNLLIHPLGFTNACERSMNFFRFGPETLSTHFGGSFVPADQILECAQCKAALTTVKRCSGCLKSSAMYCSVECQKLHWSSSHSKVCRQPIAVDAQTADKTAASTEKAGSMVLSDQQTSPRLHRASSRPSSALFSQHSKSNASSANGIPAPVMITDILAAKQSPPQITFVPSYFHTETRSSTDLSEIQKDILLAPPVVAIAKAHGAMVLVDEAHGMGFFGENGRGVYEAAGVAADVDCVQPPMRDERNTDGERAHSTCSAG